VLYIYIYIIVLKVRREIRTAIGELMEIKEQLENYGDNPSSNWHDYIQDTMECLHMLLKKGIGGKFIFI